MGKECLGTRKEKCKVSEVGMSLVCSRNSQKAKVVGPN